jgi:hypothetical protein
VSGGTCLITLELFGAEAAADPAMAA